MILNNVNIWRGLKSLVTFVSISALLGLLDIVFLVECDNDLHGLHLYNIQESSTVLPCCSPLTIALKEHMTIVYQAFKERTPNQFLGLLSSCTVPRPSM